MRPSGNFSVKGITWVLIYVVAIFPVYGNLCVTPLALAASEDPSSSEEKSGLVLQAIEYYQRGELNEAHQAFEAAESIYPNDAVIPYYLGLIYLEQGSRQKAIDQWKRYVDMAPQDEYTKEIRKNITLLTQKEAKAFAKHAVATEKKITSGMIKDNAVAVTTYKNIGSDSLGPLGKGLAALIMEDLSTDKDIKVIEREKLQALLSEMKLDSSGIVNEKSAPQVGKLLKAKYVTSGTVADADKESLQIASILFDAKANAPTGFQELKGSLKEFYDLEKQIACRIITDMGRDCKKAPEEFNKVHTKSLAALIAFAYGLEHLDAGNYDAARERFKEALDKDPNFDLAKAALWSVPTAVMLLMTESQIISSATDNAYLVSGVGAGDALASGKKGNGEESEESGGLGIGTTAAIAAGGVLVVGGIVAAVASSGGSSGSSDDDSGNADGGWNGSWQATSGEDYSGGLTLDLTQRDSSITGTMTIEGGLDCINGGEVSGDVSGSLSDSRTVNLTVSSGNLQGATLTGDISSSGDNRVMAGNIAITSGNCANVTLAFTIKTSGSADVTW